MVPAVEAYVSAVTAIAVIDASYFHAARYKHAVRTVHAGVAAVLVVVVVVRMGVVMLAGTPSATAPADCGSRAELI